MRSLALAALLLSTTSFASDRSPSAIAYAECSAGLVDQPLWESGDTEFELEDVNGDGHVDLVSIGDHGNPLIQSGEQGLMVWLGDGLGHWTYRNAGNFGYGGVALGDIDLDGTIDVAYSMHHNYAGNDFGDQLIEAALGDGTGSSWVPWDDGLATDGQTYGMFSTDLIDADGDGDLDIASASFGAGMGIHVYLNGRDGRWVRSFGFLGDNSGDVLVSGDVDNDGAPDLACAIERATVWLGDGEGFFTAADGNLPPPTTYNYRDAPSLGDIDGDGRDDLAFCDTAGVVHVWLARGAGVWVEAGVGLPTDTTCQRTQLFDMDADGNVDLALIGKAKLRVYGGNGGTSWTLRTTVTLPDTPGDAAALRTGRDVDHNGMPDLVLVESKKISTFSSRNEARVLCETSTPTTLKVRVVAPGPNRTLRAGSRSAIAWFAAVPGGAATTSTIEFSSAGATGPWRTLATARPNGGRYEWTVPAVTCSDCRVRVTVTNAEAARARSGRASRSCGVPIRSTCASPRAMRWRGRTRFRERVTRCTAATGHVSSRTASTRRIPRAFRARRGSARWTACRR